MANEYVELDELKESRGIPLDDTTDDNLLQKAITRASRAIDDRCGRRFYADESPSVRTISIYGRTVRQRDGSERILTDDISTDIGLIVEQGSNSIFSTVTSYTLDAPAAPGWPYTGLLLSSWYGGNQVRITAAWGWPAVPEPIAEATLLLANRRYARRNSPEGVSGWAQEGPVRVSRFDPDIEDLIHAYVLEGFGA